MFGALKQRSDGLKQCSRASNIVFWPRTLFGGLKQCFTASDGEKSRFRPYHVLFAQTSREKSIRPSWTALQLLLPDFQHFSGYFPALYRQVTLTVKQGIASGSFDDGPRMDRFDAFQGTRSGQLIILQDLLVGINAHINLDLGVATTPGSTPCSCRSSPPRPGRSP